MSLFHKKLRKALTHLEGTKSTSGTRCAKARSIISEHLKDVKAEFGLERAEMRLLNEYVTLLKEADKLLKDVEPDSAKEKIKEAHALIMEIELIIRNEYGEAHKWLE